MLVSHRNRFIYLKTRKTAGTSIMIYLRRFCVSAGYEVKIEKDRSAIDDAAGIVAFPGKRDPRWYNHMPAALVRTQLGSELWDNYTKVCCIRNPFDKVFSYFWYTHPILIERSQAEACRTRALFNAWVKTDGDLAIDRPMYMIDGRACLDFYIRYETLEKSLLDFCLLVGIDPAEATLSWRKGHFRPKGLDYRAYYDQDSADRVRVAYDQEFELFHYSKDL